MKPLFSYIFSFLTDGIPYILLLLPPYILFRCFRLKKNISSLLSMPKEIARAILFIYLIMLFTQTFIVNSGTNSIELIPFRIIMMQLKYAQSNMHSFLFNVIGNIGVFIPVGIIFAYLLDSDIKKTILHGSLISVFIEIVQIPLQRTTDIDDVILNTTGTVIGCFIFRLLSHILKKRTATK